jgi:hypothetical protein
MKPYTRNYKNMPISFNGVLLAAGTGKGKFNAHAVKWSDFEVFYTDKNTYFVNVATVSRYDRSENSRGFVCNDFDEVLKCLKHPIYGTLSFTAQATYNNALDSASEMGLINRSEWEIDPEEHYEIHDNYGTREGDFDFSED